MSDELRPSGYPKNPTKLRKKAAHWRRVSQLVNDTLLTHALSARARSLEKEAAEIDRVPSEANRPSLASRSGALNPQLLRWNCCATFVAPRWLPRPGRYRTSYPLLVTHGPCVAFYP